jgi:uncharacterized membrane protein HdeD (DUF308 family)
VIRRGLTSPQRYDLRGEPGPGLCGSNALLFGLVTIHVPKWFIITVLAVFAAFLIFGAFSVLGHGGRTGGGQGDILRQQHSRGG